MDCFKCCLLVLGVICLSGGVKINMQGSFSLGKDVIDTLSYLMKSGLIKPNRRSMSETVLDPRSEKIKWAIQNSDLCLNLKICVGDLGAFIKEYVTVLSTGVEGILDGIVRRNSVNRRILDSRGSIFLDELNAVLIDVSGMLKVAENEITTETETFTWLTLLKSISGRYQESVQEFIKQRLVGNPAELVNVRKRMTQKLIMAIIIVESRYERQLCHEHNLCQTEHEVTNALATVMRDVTNSTEDKAQEFIKSFYESLPKDILFFANDETTHEFQYIMSDLGYTTNNNSKRILSAILQAIEMRIQSLKKVEELAKGYDMILVHVILSDLDYFYYNKRKTYPFDVFMIAFRAWMRNGGKLNAVMRQLIQDLGKKIVEFPTELRAKIQSEARVFLELTVDPEGA